MKIKTPEGDERISIGTLAYFQARAQNNLHHIIMTEFVRCGVTWDELARRLGKKPDVVRSLLSRPRRYTIATVSDLLFAINGGALNCSIAYPVEEAQVDTSGEQTTQEKLLWGSSSTRPRSDDA